MNQYIITEELLQEAMENTTWGRTNQQKFRDKLTPYQSERDKVLDELQRWGMGYYGYEVNVATLQAKIKELRQQAGEP
jgi:hypothetical protein